MHGAWRFRRWQKFNIPIERGNYLLTNGSSEPPSRLPRRVLPFMLFLPTAHWVGNRQLNQSNMAPRPIVSKLGDGWLHLRVPPVQPQISFLINALLSCHIYPTFPKRVSATFPFGPPSFISPLYILPTTVCHSALSHSLYISPSTPSLNVSNSSRSTAPAIATYPAGFRCK